MRSALLAALITAVCIPSYAAEVAPAQAPAWTWKCSQGRMSDKETCEITVNIQIKGKWSQGFFSVTFNKDKAGKIIANIIGAPNVLAAAARVDRHPVSECKSIIKGWCRITPKDAEPVFKQMQSGKTLMVNIMTVDEEYAFDTDAESFRLALRQLKEAGHRW